MSEHQNQNPLFLHKRYTKLNKSPEVNQAVRRHEARTGERIPNTPETRIQTYLNRFRTLMERPDSRLRARGIAALKKILIADNVVRVEDVPDQYWLARMQTIRSRGQAGDWQELDEQQMIEEKERHLAQVKEDQKGSLEEWIDYLASDHSNYLPDYLKYWAFAGMLKLERYVKGKKEEGKPGRFPERPSGKQRSIKMFPEVNDRALRFIAQAYEFQLNAKKIAFRYDIPEEAQQEFLRLLETKDFRELYGWAQEHLPPISEEELSTTDGEWQEYQQGDEKKLAASLRGKGSGWCIAGENMAQDYLSRGTLHVYYSKDRDGAFSIPRVVIVQTGNKVIEVRGIEWEENVDDYIKPTNIIHDKLALLGDQEFFATDQDTKLLTAIDKKVSRGEQLNYRELVFLFEVHQPIKYFGYRQDPRIAELRAQLPVQDIVPIVLGKENEPLNKNEIAYRETDITTDTAVYIGPITPQVLISLPDSIKHIYETFPGKRLGPLEVRIPARTASERLADLEQHRIRISDSDCKQLNAEAGTTLQEETIKIIVLTPYQLGTTTSPTTTEIFGTAVDVDEKGQPAPYTSGAMTKLGLELCPAVVGPELRLQYINQPAGEQLFVGMQPVEIDGTPFVFLLSHVRGLGLQLSTFWARPTDRWPSNTSRFAFRLRQRS